MTGEGGVMGAGEKASLTAAKQKLQKATETVTDQMMLEVRALNLQP
jgi:hypothetical protein